MSVNDRLASQIKRFTKITPSNASGDGVFSFTKGNNVIRFSIAEQDAFLLAPETRLQFKINCRNAPGTGIAFNNSTNIDAKIGAQAIIQTLTISSRRYATSICEQIHNYNQLVSIAHPALSSTRDLTTQRNHEQLCVGQGILEADQISDSGQDVILNRKSMKDLQRKYITSTNDANVSRKAGFDCSLQLYAGMFMSDNIDLRLFGGLEIEITLAPDSNVFNNATATTQYEINNVILNAPLLYKSSAQMMAGVQPSQVSFLTYSSLYNVVQSTNATVTNKVGLRGALSMVQKFVPIAYLNNFDKQLDATAGANAFASWNPGVKRLTFHRNGQRFPNEYQIQTNRGDVLPSENLPNSKGAQVLINSLSAFQNYKDVKHTHLTSQNLTDLQENNFFLGVSFDQISGQGIDLSGGTVSTELESALFDPALVPGKTVLADQYLQKPFGVFTFFLNKNTLVIQPNQRIQSIE
jgi:hypothetical protein